MKKKRRLELVKKQVAALAQRGKVGEAGDFRAFSQRCMVRSRANQHRPWLWDTENISRPFPFYPTTLTSSNLEVGLLNCEKNKKQIQLIAYKKKKKKKYF